MAHLFNSGHAVVTQDPNLEPTLQSNPRMRLAVLDDGSQAFKYVDSNSAGSKWVSIPSEIGNFSSAKVVNGILTGFTNLSTILDAEVPTTDDPFYLAEVDGDVFLIFDQDNDLYTLDNSSRNKLVFINEQGVRVDDALASEDDSVSTSRYRVFPIDFGNIAIGTDFVVGNTYKFNLFQTESTISRTLSSPDINTVLAPGSINSLIDSAAGTVLVTKDWVLANAGGGLGGSVSDNQIPFGNALGEIEGSNDLLFDGTQLEIRGSGTDRFIRMSESPAQFNGGFIQYEGSTNKMHIGVHAAADNDPLNDTKVFTIQRADGFVGLNTDTPNFEFDMEGTFRNEGARISPTFTDFTNRVALVNPSFGGTRLGDSELQTPNIDIGTALNFKTTGQVTQWAAFSNAVGNTLTWRHVQNPTALFSIQNDAASSTRGVTDAESTLGLVTNYSNGDSQVFDLFNQEYIANGSVLAQAQGINMIAGNGDHRKFGIYRSDSGLTNIRTIMEVSEAGQGDQAEFFQPVKAPDAVNNDELATLGQIPDTSGFVTIAGTQTITGFKTFSSILTAATLRASSGLIGMVDGTADNVALNGFASMAADTNGDFMYNKDNSAASGWKLTTNNTAKRAYTMQDADGTVAFLSDIPSGGVSESSGTFTPTLIDIGAGATYSFSSSIAEYTRIGSLVWFTCFLSSINTTGTPTSQLQLGGLPFSVAHATPFSISLFDGGDQNFNSVVAQGTGTNMIFPIQNATDSSLGGGGTPALSIHSVTFTGGRILVSGVYKTNDA